MQNYCSLLECWVTVSNTGKLLFPWALPFPPHGSRQPSCSLIWTKGSGRSLWAPVACSNTLCPESRVALLGKLLTGMQVYQRAELWGLTDLFLNVMGKCVKKKTKKKRKILKNLILQMSDFDSILGCQNLATLWKWNCANKPAYRG